MKKIEHRSRVTLIAVCILLAAGGLSANGVEHSTVEEGPHGGLLTQADEAHDLELVTTGPAALIYVVDKDEEVVSAAGASGIMKILVPGEDKREIALTPHGSGLRGAIDLSRVVDFRALVSVDIGGKPFMGRFFQGPRKQDPGEKHGGAPSQGRQTGAGKGALAASSVPRVVVASSSITGQIIDSTCLARGELPSADHRECAERCIRGGAPVAIVERDTNQVYVAIPAREMAIADLLLPVLGLRSEFFGTIVRQGGTQFFIVERVAPEHDHSSRAGGMVAMSGDMHVEILALKTGEVRVYVSDEFRKPISIARMKGRAEARVGKGEASSAELLPDRSGQFLKTQFAAFVARQVEITVRLPLQENPAFFITFMLEPTDKPTLAPAPETPSASRAAVQAPRASPPAPPSPAVSAVSSPAGPEIRIEVKGGYKIGAGELRKGKPARLRFVRHDSGECSREVVFPALGLRRELAVGETVIDITPTKAGVLAFACGMNMMKGELRVAK